MWLPRTSKIGSPLAGSTPICWTVSLTPATRRRTVAPAADGELGLDVGDGRQGVGVFEGRQHEQAGVLALDRGEALGRAGDRQVGDGERADERGRRAAVVDDVGGDGVNAGLGVGVAAGDVEDAGRRSGDDAPTLSGEPSPQSIDRR